MRRGLHATWLAPLPIPVVAAVVAYTGVRLTRLDRLRTLAAADIRRGVLAMATLGVTLVNLEAGVAALIVLSIVDARIDAREES